MNVRLENERTADEMRLGQSEIEAIGVGGHDGDDDGDAQRPINAWHAVKSTRTRPSVGSSMWEITTRQDPEPRAAAAVADGRSTRIESSHTSTNTNMCGFTDPKTPRFRRGLRYTSNNRCAPYLGGAAAPSPAFDPLHGPRVPSPRRQTLSPSCSSPFIARRSPRPAPPRPAHPSLKGCLHDR